MTICLFGNYISDYPRIQVLKKGLTANGVKVIECHTRREGIVKYWELWRQHGKLKNDYDILLVSMGAYTLVPLARILSRKLVFFDAFVSIYLTNIEDRALAPVGSWPAKYFAWWDRFACQLAHKVLLDTNAQIEYFVSRYNLPRAKFIRVLVGADPEIFYPATRYRLPATNSFIVHWHGHIVPFHGLDTVIGAAKILKTEKDIEFHIITRFNKVSNAIRAQVENLRLDNIKFFPETSYQGLAKAINESDIVLGIFGSNEKAKRVIPNKIFEAVACGKPVITADTPAAREIFDDDSMRLISAANPQELAETILHLSQDKSEREQIAKVAYEIYKNKLIPEKTTSDLFARIRE